MRGRPRAKIDSGNVEKLAGMHCTMEEMSDFCGVGRATLYRRKRDSLAITKAVERGRLLGRIQLRRRLLELAQGKGHPAATLAIFLAKNILGYRG